MNDYKSLIQGRTHLILDLGCGLNKVSGAIGIDYMALEGVDIIHDLSQPLSFVENESVDEVHSRHVLEHMDGIEEIMSEVQRILKKGGKFVVTVPHFSNPYYYSDYTHKRFFGLYSFDYFATPETQLKRKSPIFYNSIKFDVESRKFNFFSQFRFINILKQAFKLIVNLNNYTLEFYEEVFSNIIGANEIKVVLVKV